MIVGIGAEDGGRGEVAGAYAWGLLHYSGDVTKSVEVRPVRAKCHLPE